MPPYIFSLFPYTTLFRSRVTTLFRYLLTQITSLSTQARNDKHVLDALNTVVLITGTKSRRNLLVRNVRSARDSETIFRFLFLSPSQLPEFSVKVNMKSYFLSSTSLICTHTFNYEQLYIGVFYLSTFYHISLSNDYLAHFFYCRSITIFDKKR